MAVAPDLGTVPADVARLIRFAQARGFGQQLAEASLAAAEAELSRAKSDYERDRQLYQRKLISREQHDQTTENLKVAEANGTIPSAFATTHNSG